MIKKIKLLVFFCFTLVSPSFANDLRLSALDVFATDAASDKIILTCDLKQSNSWRNTVSHDAAWVFVKYSIDGGQTWRHASMGGVGLNPAGFSMPVNFEAAVPQDLKGFFFRRSAAGTGAVEAKGLKFVWNYGLDGLSDETARAANTLIRVYGLEMVYIPEGAFFAGDGASASEYRFKQGTGDDEPWYITSENAISTANVASNGFYYQSTGASGENASGDVFLLPNSFPKGYHGFYLMKYELTEGEWVSFFNTLSSVARANRDITSAIEGGKNSDGVINRNTVAWDNTEPNTPATTTRFARAMTYISWPDAAAFADWAGLRPMTEFEFEKAARGVDVVPVVDEFAWGTAAYDAAGAEEIFPPNQDEDGTESIFDSTANLNRNTTGWTTGDGRVGGMAEGQKGALRTGVFSENATSRVTSGAGYYGNMELSGNVAEPVVSVGRAEGRQFLGSHGDGEVNTLSGFEGNATNADWPGIDLNDARRGVSGTKGIGYRGGDFQSSSLRHFQVSSRSFGAKDPDSVGLKDRFDVSAGVVYGARFARTAP
jgi:hypothetical protein